MKKKSASQSAFFNLRVLIGLFIVLAGIFLALVGFGAFPAAPGSTAQAPQRYKAQKDDPNAKRSIYQLVPPGFDCSQIYKKGIHKMENLGAGAIMIFCGEAQGGKPSPAAAFSKFVQDLLPSPLAYGTTDVNVITGTETFPNITQSETFTAANPDNPLEIVVAYNDARDAGHDILDASAASVSTDGGTTFVRLTAASGGSPFADTFGDPVVLYNRSTGTWHTVWIFDLACGGAWEVSSPPPPGTRIAGPITALTPTPFLTTESLAGPTTTLHLHSTDGCMFPGTTLIRAGGTSSSASLPTTVPLGPCNK